MKFAVSCTSKRSFESQKVNWEAKAVFAYTERILFLRYHDHDYINKRNECHWALTNLKGFPQTLLAMAKVQAIAVFSLDKSTEKHSIKSNIEAKRGSLSTF